MPPTAMGSNVPSVNSEPVSTSAAQTPQSPAREAEGIFASILNAPGNVSIGRVRRLMILLIQNPSVMDDSAVNYVANRVRRVAELVTPALCLCVPFVRDDMNGDFLFNDDGTIGPEPDWSLGDVPANADAPAPVSLTDQAAALRQAASDIRNATNAFAARRAGAPASRDGAVGESDPPAAADISTIATAAALTSPAATDTAPAGESAPAGTASGNGDAPNAFAARRANAPASRDAAGTLAAQSSS